MTLRHRLALVLAALGLCSCASTVDVPVGATTVACADLVRALPATMVGADRRAVSPADAGTAAWGDPPITLRCGVPEPAGFRGGTQLLVVDSIAWLPEQLATGFRFTARTSAGYVEVTVPTRYAPAADVLVDLAPALTSAAPATTPTG